MANTKPITLEVTSGIIEIIEKELKKLAEKRFQEMVEQLNREKEVLLSGMLIDIVRELDLRVFEDRLVITVKKLDSKKL